MLIFPSPAARELEPEVLIERVREALAALRRVEAARAEAIRHQQRAVAELDGVALETGSRTALARYIVMRPS